MRYTTQVKVFVLDARADGKGWKAIKEGIRSKFNVPPPTTRAMQKWGKNLDRAALSREIMKEMEKQTPAAGAEARQRLAEGLLPVLWRARDAGQDMALAGWKWFFSLIEAQLGSEVFEFVVNEYMRERERGKHPFPGASQEER